MRPQVRAVTVRDRDVVTAVWEGGPAAAVLVHGIGVSRRYFTPLGVSLARAGATVVAPDLPGFGASPRRAEPLTVPEHADVLAGLLEQLLGGEQRPVLVGHSMGAQVVTELASRHPGLVAGAVLVGPVAEPGARSAVRQGWRLLRDTRYESFGANLLMVRDWLRCGPRWYLRTLPELLAYPLEEHLPHVRVPVVLVRGSRDPVTPRRYLDALVEVQPSATTVEVPGEGHIAMFRRPEVVAAVCRELW
ncbi:alpha/beta fold hydrolase [Cellulomonas bogoriensis]|uniref:AB hydrolase-1 domain-containing protein n=1 Tax=Cellulomonas bogoriensis 69B4 = DSM 16987 TaxID=1386082 RepID=A0A0A0BU58_9CELL|nr:alpha/beta hydrolase [Cellulomonas bogoriensis]KGM11207.1 hypothetical protein N869_03310 [Cellulomonas bogoriensis 69B4 = DSM 16987]